LQKCQSNICSSSYGIWQELNPRRELSLTELVSMFPSPPERLETQNIEIKEDMANCRLHRNVTKTFRTVTFIECYQDMSNCHFQRIFIQSVRII
jgi:hypothetical protein